MNKKVRLAIELINAAQAIEWLVGKLVQYAEPLSLIISAVVNYMNRYGKVDK